ncbi:hypothetical protein EGW08_020034 [Elysia chlorotica]|uniref:L1 transposable element RRM domain-containing protein n=1 Tax=Elysia chlorotica TaxID=188477 RepID=A0A433SSG8_ELYCH|nr:hypothetical protein EGW08_020034 [Elysia chlorotica]
MGAVCNEMKEFRYNVEKHLKELQKEVEDMKDLIASLAGTVKEVKKDSFLIKTQQEAQVLDIDSLSQRVSSVKVQIEKIDNRVEEGERFQRRDNIILHNVPEDKDEGCKDKAVRILSQEIPSVAAQCITKAHRVGPKLRDKPRPLFVHFAETKYKIAVLSCRQALKSLGIGVSSDLTPSQRQELRELRCQGKQGFYKGGKLLIGTDPLSPPPETSAVDTTDNGETRFPGNSVSICPQRPPSRMDNV